MTDATFEDGAEKPLRLIARSVEDLRVVSALVQDAVLTGADLRFDRARRRFSLLINRYRWEDRESARGTRTERVRAVLDFADVTGAAHQGLVRDGDTILSLLQISYTPDSTTPAPDDEPAGPGQVALTFAGDGALALTVEGLEITLADVTRPYRAPSAKAPQHDL